VVLSKRERFIALATLAAVGVLALDRVVLTPLMAANADLGAQIRSYEGRLTDAQSKFDGRRRRARRWAEMQNSGLRRRDASEAESQMFNSIREWAQDSGVTLQSVKPERAEPVKLSPADKEASFWRPSLRVNGSGRMEQIGRFLWHVQTAAMPARLAEVQINTRKEGTDDLSLQMVISTIYLPPDGDKEPSAEGAGALRSREVQP